MTIDALERDLMRALLAGDDPVLETLRAQYSQAMVRDRERTPSGFVTYYVLPASTPPVDEIDHIGDLQLELEGTTTPADAVLHLVDGQLNSLECYVYEGAFPDEPVILSAYYYGTKKYPGITDELLSERDVDAALEQ